MIYRRFTAIVIALSISIVGLSFGRDAHAVRVSSSMVKQSSEPVDLSGVDWVALGRFIYGKCGEWHDTAIAAGWPESQWPTLSRVMHRESRCNPLSFNRSDPNGGSRGLIQINGYWCRKSRYNANGWLQDQGILNTCDDLFEPTTNLRAGWAMWQYSQQRNKCGWKPWATRC